MLHRRVTGGTEGGNDPAFGELLGEVRAKLAQSNDRALQRFTAVLAAEQASGELGGERLQGILTRLLE